METMCHSLALSPGFPVFSAATRKKAESLVCKVTHVTSQTRLSAFFRVGAEKAGKPGDEATIRVTNIPVCLKLPQCKMINV